MVLLEERDVLLLTAGTDEFFAHFEAKKGRRRIDVTVKEGDTWKKLSERYDLSRGMLERINHRSRRSKLCPGDTVVVYTDIAPPAESSAPEGRATPLPTDAATAVASPPTVPSSAVETPTPAPTP